MDSYIEPLMEDLLLEAKANAFNARYAGSNPKLTGQTGRLWYSKICGCWVFALRGTSDTTTIYRNAVAIAPPRFDR